MRIFMSKTWYRNNPWICDFFPANALEINCVPSKQTKNREFVKPRILNREYSGVYRVCLNFASLKAIEKDGRYIYIKTHPPLPHFAARADKPQLSRTTPELRYWCKQHAVWISRSKMNIQSRRLQKWTSVRMSTTVSWRILPTKVVFVQQWTRVHRATLQEITAKASIVCSVTTAVASFHVYLVSDPWNIASVGVHMGHEQAGFVQVVVHRFSATTDETCAG